VSGRSIEAVVTAAAPAGSVLLVARDVSAARQTDQLRRNFVANASHELKTPVSSIVGLASALELAAGDSEATGRFVGLLNREAERMAQMVSDLLDLSRLESEPGPLEPVRLDGVVAAEYEKLVGAARNAGLWMSARRVEPVTVMGREPDLGLIVHNLLSNAIRYTKPGGQVRLSLVLDAGCAVIAVEDTGVGIAPGDIDRVFERFYRVDAARDRETGGTGLGLAIVRHAAESHGGQVAVQSTRGEGSAFTVRIPATVHRRVGGDSPAVHAPRASSTPADVHASGHEEARPPGGRSVT
jgi:two-component system, OmpR family, sensor histidine kinase SenX3